MRSGSSAAGSGTLRHGEEAVDVADLVQSFFGCEPAEPLGIGEHVGVHHGSRGEVDHDIEAGGGEEPSQRCVARSGAASFDAGNHGLRRVGPVGQLPLGESTAAARLAEKQGSIQIHIADDSRSAIGRNGVVRRSVETSARSGCCATSRRAAGGDARRDDAPTANRTATIH